MRSSDFLIFKVSNDSELSTYLMTNHSLDKDFDKTSWIEDQNWIRTKCQIKSL